MALDRTAGYPDYSSGGDSKFIPELWSTKLLFKFRTASVFQDITSTEYTGQIKDVGDKIIVRTVPDITVRDYAKGQKLIYENPESEPVEMTIDYGKYFAFGIDDVDAYQSDLNLMNDWSDDAGYQIRNTVDRHGFELIYDDPAAENKGLTAGALSESYNLGAAGNPVQVTKINALELLQDANSVLSEGDIPEEDRFFIIPVWYANLIKKSDLKNAAMTGDDTSIIRNGRIGRIDGTDIYQSNNLYSVTDSSGPVSWYVMFGHRKAVNFVTQISKTEKLRSESAFGDLVRGLTVYGLKTFHDDALGVLYCRK